MLDNGIKHQKCLTPDSISICKNMQVYVKLRIALPRQLKNRSVHNGLTDFFILNSTDGLYEQY